MKIIPYDHSLRCQFEDMLVTYFVDDLQSDLTDEIVRGKLMDIVMDQAAKQIMDIAIAVENDALIGFSIYQIDSPESDWCKRPGWGFVREFFIAKGYRGKGCGKTLADYTERQLRAMGAAQIYLTSDNAIGFWERCGYSNTHEMCSNDLEILTK